MSTMTQAVSSRAISRAHRCSILDSLYISFSSSSRATAVTRLSRRVMACIAPSWDRGLGSSALGRAAASRTATSRGSDSPGFPFTPTRPMTSSHGTRPSPATRLHRSWRGLPVRPMAVSWEFNAARDGRATKAVNGRPVA